jgi:DNA-binding SARP family transcriptional activator
VRQDIVSNVARQLGAVVSKRIGIVVGIWGEPGIGKTHAAHAILERVPCRHLTIYATANGAQIAAALPRARAIPSWAQTQLARLERGDHLAPDALGQTLAATLSASAPFVLNLEDVHEADPERFEVIEALARAVVRTRGAGLLVTSRSEPPAPFLNHHLEPLSVVETAALIEQELKAEAPRDGLEWVFARTRGNPLFALEFARYLRRQGFLYSDGERWRWREPPHSFVPVSVEALLMQVIEHLATPTLRAVLEARAILSVTGDAFEATALEGVWAQVSGLDTLAFEHALDALRRAGLLLGQGFSHPLYREVIARNLRPERRRTLASLAFEALFHDPCAAAPFVDDANLSHDAALKVFQRAAQTAREASRLVEAARFTAAGVRHASGETRAELALQAARALAEAGLPEALDYAEVAASTLPEAEVLCVELLAARGQGVLAEQRLEVLSAVSPERRWRIRLQIASSRGLDAEVPGIWREHPEWQPNAPVELWRRVGGALAYLGELDAAHGIAQALLARTDLAPAEFLYARGLLAQVLQARRDWAELLEVERAIIADARSFSNARHLALALMNHASSLSSQGVRAGVRELLREASEIFGRLGQIVYHAVCSLRLAQQAMNDGLFEDAENLMDEAQAILERHDELGWRTECHLKQARLYLDWQPPHGLPLALRHARTGLELARTTQHQKLLQAALAYAACAEARGGDAALALRLAQEALDLGERQESNPSKLAEAQFACGLALEAGGQLEAGREMILRAHDAYLQLGERRNAELRGLEADRMAGNVERARARRDWLLAAGYVGTARLAERYFPQLAEAALTPLATTDVRLNVLGAVNVQRWDQPVPTRARKRLELLCRLLEGRIAGRGEASALELVDALYPQMPEPEAIKALRQLVYLVRSSLGADSVISTPTGYALGAVSSDAEDFLRTGDSSLWRSAYLGSLTEGWHTGVREALTLSLRARTEALLETDPLEVARLGGVLVEMEPFDAQVLRLAVRGLERAGNLKAARVAYREGRSRLQEVGAALPEAMEEFLADQTVA